MIDIIKNQKNKLNANLMKCIVSKHLKDDIKIKREVDGKIDLYSDCFNCNFERFRAINKEELSGLFEISIYM